jgi:hypothetical protein
MMRMSKPYLEVTYRQGKPFAAYLYLRRGSNDRSARTERRGYFLIDFAADGRAIGIEFTSLGGIDAAAVNQILSELNEASLPAADLAPLTAA